jgi:hypothetical protein
MPEDMARPPGGRRRVEATALPGWIKPQLTRLVDQSPCGPAGNVYVSLQSPASPGQFSPAFCRPARLQSGLILDIYEADGLNFPPIKKKRNRTSLKHISHKISLSHER